LGPGPANTAQSIRIQEKLGLQQRGIHEWEGQRVVGRRLEVLPRDRVWSILGQLKSAGRRFYPLLQYLNSSGKLSRHIAKRAIPGSRYSSNSNFTLGCTWLRSKPTKEILQSMSRSANQLHVESQKQSILIHVGEQSSIDPPLKQLHQPQH